MIPVDTLVHISAPTTKQADDGCKACAMAYLGFQPAVRHDIIRKGEHFKPSTRPSNTAARKNGKSNQPTTPDMQQPDLACNDLPPTTSTVPISSAMFMANAALDVLVTTTQQMFDTQYAAAGISSQISVASSTDVPLPTTEVRKVLKRSWTSDSKEGREFKRVRQQLKRPTPETAEEHSSFNSPSISISSRNRRDSQSAEAPSPNETPKQPSGRTFVPPVAIDHQTNWVKQTRPLSPSSAMEQEIEAYKKLRHTNPEVFRCSGDKVDEIVGLISSILPNTYGLSKSEDASNTSDTSPINATDIPQPNHHRTATDHHSHGGSIHDTASTTTRAEPIPSIVGIELKSSQSSAVNNQDHSPSDPRCTDTAAAKYVSRIHQAHDHNFMSDICDFAMNSTDARKTSTSSSILARPLLSKSLRTSKKVLSPPSITSIKDHVSRKSLPSAYTKKSKTSFEDVHNVRSPHIRGKQEHLASEKEQEAFLILQKMPRHIFNDALSKTGRSHSATDRSQEYHLEQAMRAERLMLLRRTLHRGLDHIERGFWHVSMSSWTLKERLGFLQDLEIHIDALKGDPWIDVNFGEDGLPVSADLYSDAPSLGEAWLLLTVLSDRRTAMEDMNWIGWDGKPAVTMAAKAMMNNTVKNG